MKLQEEKPKIDNILDFLVPRDTLEKNWKLNVLMQKTF